MCRLADELNYRFAGFGSFTIAAEKGLCLVLLFSCSIYKRAQSEKEQILPSEFPM